MARLAVLLFPGLGLSIPCRPFCAGALAQESTARLDRQARLVVEDVLLAEALEELGRLSGAAIAFSPDVLPPRHRVACDCRDATVRVALDRLLAGTGLRYVERGPRILIVPEPRGDPRAGTLTGLVVESGADTPLAGALVQLVPNRRRVLSDQDGRFVLGSLRSGDCRLRLTAVGFVASDTTVTIERDGVTDVVVALRREPIVLPEIVVTPGNFGFLERSPSAGGSLAGRAEIESSPALGDDPFRVLAGVPGVSTNDLSAKLNVRGGTAEDLLMRLDGVELLEPYHLPELDGVFGIVDVQALGSIELMTGGFPVEFGDRWAGVLDMRTRQPPQSGSRTTAGLSLSSLSLISQGTAFGGRGQWLVSLRRGSLDLLLGLTGVKDDLSPRYWDALSRVDYFLSDRHRVSLEVLHAGDRVTWRAPGSSNQVVDSRWASTYAWVTWDATFAPGFHATTSASVSRLTRDRVGAGGAPDDGVLHLHPLASRLRDERRTARFDLRHDWLVELDGGLTFKAGFDVRAGSADYDYSGFARYLDYTEDGRILSREETTTVSGRPTERSLGTYGSLRWKPTQAVTWEAGVRYDSRSHSEDADLSPRVSVRWDPAARTSLTASLGRYFRSRGLHELKVSDGETAFPRSELADQVAFGAEHELGRGFTVRFEGYLRRVDRVLPDYVNLGRELNPMPELDRDRAIIEPTRERADGAGLVVQWDAGRDLSLGAHYTLARAVQRVGGSWIPGMFDQRHTLHLQGSYRRGTKWQFGLAWHYHSGWPVSEPSFRAVTGTVGSGPEWRTIVLQEYGALNAERLPDYHRLDLRVTRSFHVGAGRVDAYLDVFNVYARVNLQGFGHNLALLAPGQLTATRRPGMELLPILPTLGLRWEF